MSDTRELGEVLDETLMLEVDRILDEIGAELGGIFAHRKANVRASMKGALERNMLDRFFVAQGRLKVLLARVRLRERVSLEEFDLV